MLEELLVVVLILANTVASTLLMLFLKVVGLITALAMVLIILWLTR